MKYLHTIPALLCLGCIFEAPKSKPSPDSPPTVTVYVHQPTTKGAKPTAYTRQEFRDAVIGLSPKDIKRIMGPPSKVDYDGSWEYKDFIINPATGKPEHMGCIYWDHNGACEFVIFLPALKGDPR